MKLGVSVLLCLLVFCALGAVLGYRYGMTDCTARQTQQERLAKEALQKEVQRSQTAAQQSLAAQDALQTSYRKLEGKFRDLKQKNVPLLSAPTPPQTGTGTAGLGHSLSLGAVWMWNSALDPNRVPAAACASADATPEACAAAAGIGLSEAWDNHTANARSCAEDRLRFQQLIDYLSPAGASHAD